MYKQIIYYFSHFTDTSTKVSAAMLDVAEVPGKYRRHVAAEKEATVGDASKNNYLLLLTQREEENRQEVAKLTAEIRSLKLKVLQLQGMILITVINIFN